MSLLDDQRPSAFTSAPASPVDEPEEIIAPAGTRAVLYLRVSSKGQVNTDYDPEGLSIPAQRSSCVRKAEQMGLNVVSEYVEPGKSATEMTRRVAFQQMLERIRREKDIDYVIVYELSRLTRNRTDDAIVMADLKKRGVTLISATESIDESPVGQLMQGLLAAFNEYRSAKDGADIAYKMSQKAKTGGTIGRAPIGYINSIDRYDGREIRSVTVDAERAPFVKHAFAMYATGDHTMEDIVDTLTDRGLTTRPTGRHPAGPVSMSKMSRMLRDKYYLGLVVYKGEVFDGRHPAIVEATVFDRVQDLLTTRGVAGERRRLYPHYLKGSVWCGHCKQERDIPDSRMIVQRSIGNNGGEYFYFFCRGKQEGVCDSRYIPQIALEDAVTEHYKTAIQFKPDFIAAIKALIESTLGNAENAQKLLHHQLRQQLKALSVKTDNLIDLAADGQIAAERVRAKLREIERQRARLQEQLDQVTDDLSVGGQYISDWLDLLADPHTLYKQSSDETRRKLNQAIFIHIWVRNDEVVDFELNEPVAELLAAQKGFAAQKAGLVGDAVTKAAYDQLAKTRPPQRVDALRNNLDDLLQAMEPAQGSSKPSMVPLEGFEPPTVSLGRNCSSVELQRLAYESLAGAAARGARLRRNAGGAPPAQRYLGGYR
jgi:site-specific DNA recombinase